MDEDKIITIDEFGHRHMDGRQLADCDEQCLAVDDPKTEYEFRQAYKHWRRHSYLAGCSHAR